MYWIIIALLAAWAIWALRRIYIRKKQGRSCCGSCSSCPYKSSEACSDKKQK